MAHGVQLMINTVVFHFGCLIVVAVRKNCLNLEFLYFSFLREYCQEIDIDKANNMKKFGNVA